MLRAFPAPSNCYLYGPVCVTESERGNRLAAMMYHLPGRTAMSFVRSDNVPSLKANRKMGKMELGEFEHDGESYIVFAFRSTSDRFPLYPQKRTLAERVEMSALCQKRTFCGAAK
jgi:hypothetical protein